MQNHCSLGSSQCPKFLRVPTQNFLTSPPQTQYSRTEHVINLLALNAKYQTSTYQNCQESRSRVISIINKALQYRKSSYCTAITTRLYILSSVCENLICFKSLHRGTHAKALQCRTHQSYSLPAICPDANFCRATVPLSSGDSCLFKQVLIGKNALHCHPYWHHPGDVQAIKIGKIPPTSDG